MVKLYGFEAQSRVRAEVACGKVALPRRLGHLEWSKLASKRITNKPIAEIVSGHSFKNKVSMFDLRISGAKGAKQK